MKTFSVMFTAALAVGAWTTDGLAKQGGISGGLSAAQISQFKKQLPVCKTAKGKCPQHVLENKKVKKS